MTHSLSFFLPAKKIWRAYPIAWQAPSRLTLALYSAASAGGASLFGGKQPMNYSAVYRLLRFRLAQLVLRGSGLVKPGRAVIFRLRFNHGSARRHGYLFRPQPLPAHRGRFHWLFVAPAASVVCKGGLAHWRWGWSTVLGVPLTRYWHHRGRA